jgi:hypothetical protein
MSTVTKQQIENDSVKTTKRTVKTRSNHNNQKQVLKQPETSTVTSKKIN